MKKLTIVSALLISTMSGFGIIDTIRYYDASNGVSSYNISGVLFVSRFMPKASGIIKSITVTLIGPTGTAMLHIYGHEGGATRPHFETDLISPLQITKSSMGVQKISIEIPDSIYVANNQFFVGISDLSSGVKMVNDNVIRGPHCESNSGGKYYLMYTKDSGGKWYYSTRAFIVEAVMDYPDTISPSYFQDVTVEAGIDANHANSHIAWADFNKDGYIDLLLGNVLYKNNKDGTFTYFNDLAGISAKTSIGAFADMNNDGELDILLIRDNESKIYLNNGDETFTEHKLDSLPPLNVSLCYSIADFNNDKYPDLYVGRLWVPYPDPLPNYLFINDQNLEFINFSALLYPQNDPAKQTRACSCVDFNDDGHMDLYVTNYYLQRDELWQNNGDETFTNVIDQKLIDYISPTKSNHGTGVEWADFDNDGDMDLLLPQLAHPDYMIQYGHQTTTIYRNEGPPNYNFTDLTGQHGIEYEETHAGGTWGDINNDGLLDLFLTVFYGCRYVDVYLQKPDHTFELKTFEFGLQNVVTSKDAVFIDYNNDGKLDLAGGEYGKFRLYKNTGPFNDNYVEINLECTSGNSFAIGARATVYAGNEMFTREVIAGKGASMQKPYRLHFGLGDHNNIDSVTVRWPNGTANTETFYNLKVKRIYTLKEGGEVIGSISEDQEDLFNIVVFPNPFKENLIFIYELNSTEHVKLEIYSLVGQRIKVMVDEKQGPGKHVISWDAKDGKGNRLTSGFYFSHFTAGNIRISNKIIMIQSILR